MSCMTRKTPPRSGRAAPEDSREARLADALRANLRRRKAAVKKAEPPKEG
jgi:hypothetical protein